MDIREKRANEAYAVGFDFSVELAANETISSANVTCSNGLNSTGNPVISGNNVSQYVSGGTAGTYYSVTIKITTNANNVFERAFIVRVVTDVVPAAANANISLVRLDEAKAIIGKVTDEDTSIIEMIIESVSREFNAYCDRVWATTTYNNATFDGNGKAEFWLPNFPITGNMTVYEDDVLLTSGNDNDYLCYNNTGRLVRVNKTWYEGSKTLKITYTAGYTCLSGNTDLPLDVRLAALKQVAHEFGRFQHKDWGIDSVTYPDGSMARSQSGLLKDVRDVLDIHRRLTL